MYCIQNLTNRKIIFQGMEIKPHGSITLATVSDFVCLSKFINAGKLSYTITNKTPAKKPEIVSVETKAETPEIICKPAVEEVKETVTEEPVIESTPEDIVVSEPEDTFVEEDRPTSKKGRKKRFDKLD